MTKTTDPNSDKRQTLAETSLGLSIAAAAVWVFQEHLGVPDDEYAPPEQHPIYLMYAGLAVPAPRLFYGRHESYALFALANLKLSMSVGRDPLIRIGTKIVAVSWHEAIRRLAIQILKLHPERFERIEESVSKTNDGHRLASRYLQDAAAAQDPPANGNEEVEDWFLAWVAEAKHYFQMNPPNFSEIDYPLPDIAEVQARLAVEALYASELLDHTHLMPDPMTLTRLPPVPRVPKRPTTPLSEVDKRDKWVYDQLLKGDKKQTAVLKTLRELCPKQGWPDTLKTANALVKAANRWAKKGGKPDIPKRRKQSG